MSDSQYFLNIRCGDGSPEGKFEIFIFKAGFGELVHKSSHSIGTAFNMIDELQKFVRLEHQRALEVSKYEKHE